MGRTWRFEKHKGRKEQGTNTNRKPNIEHVGKKLGFRGQRTQTNRDERAWRAGLITYYFRELVCGLPRMCLCGQGPIQKKHGFVLLMIGFLEKSTTPYLTFLPRLGMKHGDRSWEEACANIFDTL